MSEKRKKDLKQKRKSGGGRKPAGPFKNNTAQLTIRMPDDLRKKLETSAKGKDCSLTQELLWRLQSSYRKQHEEEFRTPATRAICFLIANLADRISGQFAEFAGSHRERLALWHRNPFQFHAFRLAVAQLLEALEPRGDMQNPYEPIVENFPKNDIFKPKYDEMAADLRTPETLANWFAEIHTSRNAISEVRSGSSGSTGHRHTPGLGIKTSRRICFGRSL